MTTEHKIEIRESEYDALIKLYEESEFVVLGVPSYKADKDFKEAYLAAKKEVDK